MNQMDVMRAFVRVVELGTFSEAARVLNVKQSTISKWMSQLEEQVGTQLLERTTRARHLTDAGRLYYESALRILTLYDETLTRLHSNTVHLAGNLRVSAPVVFGQQLILPHLGDFMRAYPMIELDVRFNDHYVNMVEEGFDVAVRVGTPVDSSLKAKTIARIERVLVASPDFLQKLNAPIEHPNDLRRCDCLVHAGAHTPTSWSITREDEHFQVPVSGPFRANNSHALIEMATQGFGVVLIARWLVEAQLQHGHLVQLLTNDDAGVAYLQMLTTPGEYTHPKVEAFISFMSQRLATHLTDTTANH